MASTRELEPLFKLLGRKDGLSIFMEISEKPRQFKELSGNMMTRSERLRELTDAGLIEVRAETRKRGRPILVYQLTETGKRVCLWLDHGPDLST